MNMPEEQHERLLQHLIDTQALLQRAKYTVAIDKLTQVINLYKKFGIFNLSTEEKKDFALTYGARGDIWMNINQFNFALRDYNAMIDLYSYDIDAYIMRGKLNYRLGNISAAQRDYRTASSLLDNETLSKEEIASYHNILNEQQMIIDESEENIRNSGLSKINRITEQNSLEGRDKKSFKKEVNKGQNIDEASSTSTVQKKNSQKSMVQANASNNSTALVDDSVLNGSMVNDKDDVMSHNSTEIYEDIKTEKNIYQQHKINDNTTVSLLESIMHIQQEIDRLERKIENKSQREITKITELKSMIRTTQFLLTSIGIVIFVILVI